MEELTKKQAYGKKRYKENRERLLSQANNYHFKNREIINKRRAEKRRERGEAVSEYRPRPRGETALYCTKQEVIQKYGGYCVCCFESHFVLLTIDHINNDGHTFKNGKTRMKGIQLYKYLKKENFPLNVQVLCFNCNIGKYNNGGICPHKGEKSKATA